MFSAVLIIATAPRFWIQQLTTNARWINGGGVVILEFDQAAATTAIAQPLPFGPRQIFQRLLPEGTPRRGFAFRGGHGVFLRQ